MTDTAELVARLARRAEEDGDPVRPPLDPAELARAEEALGFALHPLLAAVYTRVGDGGFGPECHLLNLTGRFSAVDNYLGQRRELAGTDWAWPEGVLPVLDWGCGMFACVDCRSDEGTVLLFEPNPGDPDTAWFVDAPSLAGWFTRHLENTGWWGDEDEPVDMPLWPDARSRAATA
ncbi:SMI1/KNR4 family protein [Longispora sp. K20-0274]|uniref:SMI1/KNR4 family protein n=1 Tax=Longispora sp. K20-0274 TaxID=3088255 RepID=UPI00399B793F